MKNLLFLGLAVVATQSAFALDINDVLGTYMWKSGNYGEQADVHLSIEKSGDSEVIVNICDRSSYGSTVRAVDCEYTGSAVYDVVGEHFEFKKELMSNSYTSFLRTFNSSSDRFRYIEERSLLVFTGGGEYQKVRSSNETWEPKAGQDLEKAEDVFNNVMRRPFRAKKKYQTKVNVGTNSAAASLNYVAFDALELSKKTIRLGFGLKAEYVETKTLYIVKKIKSSLFSEDEAYYGIVKKSSNQDLEAAFESFPSELYLTEKDVKGLLEVLSDKLESYRVEVDKRTYEIEAFTMNSMRERYLYKITLLDDSRNSLKDITSKTEFYGITSSDDNIAAQNDFYEAAILDLELNHINTLKLKNASFEEEWVRGTSPIGSYKIAVVESSMQEAMDDYKSKYSNYGVITWNDKIFNVKYAYKHKNRKSYDYLAFEVTRDRSNARLLLLTSNNYLIPVKEGKEKQAIAEFKKGELTYLVGSRYQSSSMTYDYRSVHQFLLKGQLPVIPRKEDVKTKVVTPL